MASKKRPPDENQLAAQVAHERARRSEADEAPADVEATWAQWSRKIKGLDDRTMTLMRAAFDAGVDAGRTAAGRDHGRAGGLKGGAARARKLSKERLREIAAKAARKRWGHEG